MKITNFERLKTLPLTEKEKKPCYKQKLCHIVHWKVRDHDYYTGKYRGAVQLIFNLWFKNMNEIPVVLQNGSNYDCHLFIKELYEELKGQLECLGENTEKYIPFSVTTEK